MASSRIFVRSLPPHISQDEIRAHFAHQNEVTDVRHMQKRRIAYVGYGTAENAQSAIKYFNKSYIGMCRIFVEEARPISVLSTGHVPAQIDLHTTDDPGKVVPAKRSADSYMEERKRRTTEVERPTTATDVETAQSLVSKKSENDYDNLPTAVVDHDANERSIHINRAISDAEWSRTHTSRLLDLDDPTNEQAVDQNHKETHPTNDPESKTEAYPNSKEPSPITNDEQNTTTKLQDTSVYGTLETLNCIKRQRRLFVRNLSYSATEDDLREFFSKFGVLSEVHMPISSQSGQGKGFAYIMYENGDDAITAYKTVDGGTFKGRLLHLLPANAPTSSNAVGTAEFDKLSLKKKRLAERKSLDPSHSFNWNSLYLNIDEVLTSVSARLMVPKSELLDPTSAEAAVAQARAETHLISETKTYFMGNGIDIEAFKHKSRGELAILVKNLPYGTTYIELKELFEAYGQVTHCLVPPGGIVAIVRFAYPQHARLAFKSLCYRKFKDAILYLEKAPENLFSHAPSSTNSITPLAAKSSDDRSDENETTATDQSDNITTLFVRNLNFTTTSEDLSTLFRPIDGLISATLKTKPDPKNPGKLLSLGFGFLHFKSPTQALAAMKTMDGYNAQGHKLSIKLSERIGDDTAKDRKSQVSGKGEYDKTKIAVKNLPFEASRKDVRALFGTYGQLRSVRLPRKFDATTRGFAFVEFTTAREATNAMNALRNTHLLGRRLILEFAEGVVEDPIAAIEKMQKRAGLQMSSVTLKRLTHTSNKKLSMDTMNM